MRIQVFYAPFFGVQGAFLVGDGRVTRAAKFGQLAAVRRYLSNLVLRFVNGNDCSNYHSFCDRVGFRGTIFVDVLFGSENRFVVNGVLLKDAMRVRVPLGATWPPRVLALGVDAHAPTMSFGNCYVFAFFRFINGVPFNENLEVLVMSWGLSVCPYVVG